MKILCFDVTIAINAMFCADLFFNTFAFMSTLNFSRQLLPAGSLIKVGSLLMKLCNWQRKLFTWEIWKLRGVYGVLNENKIAGFEHETQTKTVWHIESSRFWQLVYFLLKTLHLCLFAICYQKYFCFYLWKRMELRKNRKT